MTYRIAGLPHETFAHYFTMNREDLAFAGARRVTADADRGFPCRVSLVDAKQGESLILLNYVSHDVSGPYRTAYAIYVRETATQSVPWTDCLLPVFAGRTLSLRGFDGQGDLLGARVTAPDEADEGIRDLFSDTRVSCIHAHNAAYGCFAARIERHGDDA